MYSGMYRVSWNLDVLQSIRQFGPGVIISLGIIESLEKLVSALGVIVDNTQVGVFVVGVFVDVEGVFTNNADVAAAVVVEIAGERAERLDGAVDHAVLVRAVVRREAEGLTLLGAGNIGL